MKLLEYTEAEVKLLLALGIDMKLIETINMPSALYHIAMEKVFIENKQGPPVEALRRVITAFSKCSPYRHTKEFDALCNFVYAGQYKNPADMPSSFDIMEGLGIVPVNDDEPETHCQDCGERLKNFMIETADGINLEEVFGCPDCDS